MRQMWAGDFDVPLPLPTLPVTLPQCHVSRCRSLSQGLFNIAAREPLQDVGRTGDREPNIAPQPKIGRGFGCSDLNIFQTIELKRDFKKVALVDVNLNLRGSNCAFVEPSTHCVETKLKLSVPTDSVKGHTVSGGPIITLHADLKCPQQKKCRSDAGSVKVPLYRFTEYVESPPVNEGKKKCGSGYFAAGWLCCRALQEKTGDGKEEGASGAKESVEGLNQFGLNGVESFGHGLLGRRMSSADDYQELPQVCAYVLIEPRKASEHSVQHVPLVELPLSAADIAAACGNGTAAVKSLCPSNVCYGYL
ncbi:hypothetical protein B0H16DRAFT_1463240 [Mycena metata]|uniref:Uncharacterized protein n=1 Tax=Mycena metata TaxID=1033252 RepID=A0AAD7N4R7_9AGAR|nr:hypothetical protein B0H16DRAFT_1463240 [Mycena metata]